MNYACAKDRSNLTIRQKSPLLWCLYGSEMVLLGVVIRKCETPTTNNSQENGHGILMITCQFVAYN